MSASTHGRAQLLLPFRNRRAFLEQYFDKGETGGLFVAGELDVKLGEEVDLEIAFHEEHARFHVRAVAKWKRHSAGRRAIPPGVGLEFLPTEQRTKDLLLAFAEGKEVHHVERENRRFALSADVRVRADGQQVQCVTEDLSDGGCFVRLDSPLAIGTSVEVRLREPGALFGWLTLDALVAWRREEADRTGVGLEFQFPTEKKRAKLQKIVGLLRERQIRELRVTTPKPPTSSPPKSADTSTKP